MVLYDCGANPPVDHAPMKTHSAWKNARTGACPSHHPAREQRERADDEPRERDEPDGTRRLHDVGQEALVFAFAHVDLVGTCGSLEEERERDDDDALPAGVREQVAPHVEAVAHVVEVLEQVQAGRRVAAHHVEHRVEVAALVARQVVRQAPSTVATIHEPEATTRPWLHCRSFSVLQKS